MPVFDRCDENTIAVFDTALGEAQRLGHNYLGTEHLLLALVRHREILPRRCCRAPSSRRRRCVRRAGIASRRAIVA